MPTPAGTGAPLDATTARSLQPLDLRRRNISAVMRTVLSHGPLARTDVARLTGLTPGSVTKLTAHLTGAGLLREEPSVGPARSPGRPRVPVAIDPRYQVIGVHIGLLWTMVGVLDLTGHIVDEVTMPHDSTSFDAVTRAAADRVRRLLRGRSGRFLLGVGSSTGGWVDPATGHVVEHAALGWHNAPLRDTLAATTRLPVVVDGTVRAMALAESWLGVGKDVRSLLHVFVGNVVGAGIVIDRRLHGGPDSAAGYLDHLPVGVRTARRCGCGRYDCLQAVASDVVLVAEARERGIISERGTVDDLAARARDGDRRAVTLLRTRARYVGHAIALLTEILNPERVVVGGGVVDAPEYLSDVQAGMAERIHRPLLTDPADLVRATTFGRHAVMLASAALFLDEYYRDPMAYPPLTPAR